MPRPKGLRRLARIAARSPFIAEALIALAIAKVSIRLPFRGMIGNQLIAPPPSALDRDALRLAPRDAQIRAIGRIVDRVADLLPWSSTCLVRALANRRMLHRRSIPATLRLGVRNGDGGLAAHAWLEAGDGIVCGGPAAEGYTHLVGFAAAEPGP